MENETMTTLVDYDLPEKRTGYVDKEFKTIRCPYCGEIYDMKFDEESIFHVRSENDLLRLTRKARALFGTADLEEIAKANMVTGRDRIKALGFQTEMMALKCPSCGRFPSNIQKPGHFNSGITRYKVLLKGDILHLWTVYAQRYSFKESRKVKVKPYIFDLCFNLRTGMSYETPIHSLGRKFKWEPGKATELSFKLLSKKRCNLNVITSNPMYRHPFTISNFFQEEINLFKILEDMGYNTAFLKEKDVNRMTASDLAAWNYNKDVDPQIAGPYCAELERCEIYGTRMEKAYRRQYSILKKHSKAGTLYKYINNVCKRRKIGKRIKKLFYLDWRTMCIQKRLHELGVVDQNYIYKLLTMEDTLQIIPNIIWDKEAVKFIEKIYELFGQKNLVGVLSSQISQDGSYYTFPDTIWMYNECVMLEASKDELKECLRGTSIKEIHDNLSELHDVKNNENVELKYTSYEYALEDDIDGYRFKLPADTEMLRDVGRRMNICVGSYDKLALSKKSTIVIMKKDGKYKVCIELQYDSRSRKYKGIQFKANSNFYAQDEDAAAILAWVKKHHIDVNRCEDYLQAKENWDNYRQFLEKEKKAEIVELEEIEVEERTNLFKTAKGQ